MPNTPATTTTTKRATTETESITTDTQYTACLCQNVLFTTSLGIANSKYANATSMPAYSVIQEDVKQLCVNASNIYKFIEICFASDEKLSYHTVHWQLIKSKSFLNKNQSQSTLKPMTHNHKQGLIIASSQFFSINMSCEDSLSCATIYLSTNTATYGQT